MAGKKDKIKDKDRFTIIQPNGFTNRCFFCGSNYKVAKHEVFGGNNRAKSKEDGMIVELCGTHHNLSKQGVHFNKDLDLKLKKQAEKIWINYYTNKELPLKERISLFIGRYGMNYLDDEDFNSDLTDSSQKVIY